MTEHANPAITEHGDESDVDTLRSTLFGRSVLSVQMYGDEGGPEAHPYGYRAEGEVHLDDGTVLYLGGNVGGCICGAGDYALTRLNALPANGITDVQVQVADLTTDPEKDEWYEDGHIYSIFVLAMGEEPVEVAAFEGDDGNGYYGTGFWFSILPPDSGSPEAGS